MKKVIILSAIVLVGSIGVYYFVTFLAVQSKFASDDISNDLKFESRTWTEGTIRQRGQMVNYLLDSIGLVDKTKEEINKLLGPPDSENNMADGEYKSKFYYSVDKGDAFTYDMIVFFDSTDNVKFILFDD
jgi:hypothetical protein